MKGEFYKMEFEAWDEGTIDLSLELEAAYLRLCHQMYRRQGPVPNSTRLLCAIWRCHHRKATSLLKALIDAGKIEERDGNLSCKKVDRVLNDRALISNNRRNAGQLGGERSAIVRSNHLKNNDVNEAYASTPTKQNQPEERRGEETRIEETEAAVAATTSDQEVQYFRRFKEICGQQSGGLATKLIKAKHGSVTDARIALEQASKKQNPREYIGAVIRGASQEVAVRASQADGRL